MNRSKIEWCDHTYNPVTGCRHHCEYCYARKMAKRFAGNIMLNKMAKKDYSLVPSADGGGDLYLLDTPMINETGNPLIYPFGFEPTFHRYRVDSLSKLKMGNIIFVGAMCDMFGSWVPDEWIKEIFNTCMNYPIHNYLFLTKNPKRYIELAHSEVGLPVQKNMWYGSTITNPHTEFYWGEGINTFLNIEPLFEPFGEMENIIQQSLPNWVVIGAETGRRKDKVIPKREWIEDIIKWCEKSKIPVFMKDSLIPIVGEDNMLREFPEQLQHLEISPKMKKKLFDVCAGCKTYLKKSEMVTLLARSKRGEQPKQFCFLCKDCFKQFCEKRELELPALKELVNNSDIKTDK